MRGGIIQEIVTLIKNRNLIEHLEVEEEWIVQHIWNHKEDVDSSTLLKELQAELPELKRSHMVYLLQRCAEKEYIGTYRKGRKAMIHCKVNIVEADMTPKIEA